MDFFSDLTPKQALFCHEYFKDFNATKAALRAGYSPATALNGRLMMVPKIKYHLKQRGAEAAEQAQVTQAMVLGELKKIAFASMGSYFGADGKVRPLQEVDEDTKAALLNYTVTEDKHGTTTIKIRMNNKLSALDKIAKHLKFYDAQYPVCEVNYWVADRPGLEECDRIDDDSFSPESEVLSQESVVLSQEEVDKRVAEAVLATEERMRAEFKKNENTHIYPPAVEEGARNKEQGQVVSVEALIAEARAEAVKETEKRMCDELGDEWLEIGQLYAELAKSQEKKKEEVKSDAPPFGKYRDRDNPRYVNMFR